MINGNGELHTEFRNYKECTGFETWGKLVDGKKHGEWTFSNIKSPVPIATETYEEGVFVKGTSRGSVYTEKPSIKLSKFYPNENLNLVKNSLGCPGGGGISYWQYEGGHLNTTFYPQLQEAANKLGGTFKNQWLIVGVKIGKDNQVQEINIASSINDKALENRLYTLIQNMQSWQAAMVSAKPVASDLFFSSWWTIIKSSFCRITRIRTGKKYSGKHRVLHGKTAGKCCVEPPTLFPCRQDQSWNIVVQRWS